MPVIQIILLLFPLAAVAADGTWPMFRGNAQLTGVAKDALPSSLSLRWKFAADDAIGSTAAIVGETVYIGSDDEHLYALVLRTGALKWKYHANDFVQSSPTVLEGIVYFGDDEGMMHALDCETGKVRWTFETNGQIISSVNHSNGRLVFGSYDGYVYCLDRAGKLLWKRETEGRVHGTPGMVEGHVLVAGCDEYFHVFAASDGRSIRRLRMGSVSGASPALLGTRVFVGTYGGQVLAINWQTGDLLWVYEDADRSFPFLSSAAVTPEAIIIGGRDKRLRALHPETGRELWRFSTRARIDSSPVVVGGRVFVGSSDGFLYALSRTTGKEMWRFETGAPITASPAIGYESLVIGAQDGVVYCFGSARPIQ